MPNRGAPSEPSPEPYVPIVTSNVTDGPCLLCGDPLGPWHAQWCELIGAEERTTGFAHTRCVHEYWLFAAQMPFAAALQTPLI